MIVKLLLTDTRTKKMNYCYHIMNNKHLSPTILF